jgi:hypothetical protein
MVGAEVVAGEEVKASKVEAAAVEVEARRCIKRATKEEEEEAVAVARKCTVTMAVVKCTIAPSMVTAIDIGAAVFGYTTITMTTTDRTVGGVTAIAIAGIIDLFRLKESGAFYRSLATASGRRVQIPAGALGQHRRRLGSASGLSDAACALFTVTP